MKKICICGLVLILIVSLSISVMSAYQRIIVKQDISSSYRIIVDNKTGVNYLEHYGYGGAYGITVMYDSNGKVLIEK